MNNSCKLHIAFVKEAGPLLNKLKLIPYGLKNVIRNSEKLRYKISDKFNTSIDKATDKFSDVYQPSETGDSLNSIRRLLLRMQYGPRNLRSRFVSPFRGDDLNRTLVESAASGTAAGAAAHYASGEDASLSKTLSSALLGALVPGAAKGSYRAGKTLASNLKFSDELLNAGMLPYADTRIKAIPNALFDTFGMATKSRKAEARKEILEGLSSLFKKPKELVVGKLSNEDSDISKFFMQTAPRAAEEYGVKVLNAGPVVNPNIAANIQSGKIQSFLKRKGFERLRGESLPVRQVNPEIVKRVNKAIAYDEKGLPQLNNRALSWKKFPEATPEGLKKTRPGSTWPGFMKRLGFRDANDYEAYKQQLNIFLGNARDTLRATDGNKKVIPNLKNYFDPRKQYFKEFDYTF